MTRTEPVHKSGRKAIPVTPSNQVKHRFDPYAPSQTKNTQFTALQHGTLSNAFGSPRQVSELPSHQQQKYNPFDQLHSHQNGRQLSQNQFGQQPNFLIPSKVFVNSENSPSKQQSNIHQEKNVLLQRFENLEMFMDKPNNDDEWSTSTGKESHATATTNIDINIFNTNLLNPIEISDSSPSKTSTESAMTSSESSTSHHHTFFPFPADLHRNGSKTSKDFIATTNTSIEASNVAPVSALRKNNQSSDLAPSSTATWIPKVLPKETYPLPNPHIVLQTGHILSRISVRTMFLKKWKQTFWMQYGPTVLLVFRCKEDAESWLYNPCHNTKARKALIKLKIDFVRDLMTTVRGYKAAKISSKYYAGNNYFQFKLERHMDQGSTNVAAFGSEDHDEVKKIRDIILHCIKNGPKSSFNTFANEELGTSKIEAFKGYSKDDNHVRTDSGLAKKPSHRRIQSYT